MGNLMKDAPATRYALLDRIRPESQKASPTVQPEKNIRSAAAPRHQLPPPPIHPKKYRSTAEELEAYVRHISQKKTTD
jgi:hypothetical protein